MSYHPPYSNYSQYYYNQPSTSQSPWSARPQSRPGWHDPRNEQEQYGQQPQQGSVTGTSNYNPNQYGPMPGASPAQAQAPQPNWGGVKYQQQGQEQQYQLQQGPKPPLPPRPLSATGQLNSSAALYSTQSHGAWQARPTDGQYTATQPYTSSEPWASQYGQYQPTPDVMPPAPPPPPPKITSDFPHEHYAQKPSTHYHEPSTNPNWPQTSTGTHSSTYIGQEQFGHGYNSVSASQNQALVSPVDPVSTLWALPGENVNTAPLSQTMTNDHYHAFQTPLQGDLNFGNQLPSQASTALGYGGPSDWEHFAPEPHVVSPEIRYSTPTDSKPPASPRTATPKRAIDQPPEQKPSPGQVEQHRPQSQGTSSARTESLSSVEPESGLLQRTGTIDSVIHAWNAPLQPRRKSIRNTSVSGSPSPQRANQSTVHGQNQVHMQELHAQTPTPQSFVAASADPYSDLEPQFQASLARFVGTLRREQAAESDEERFKIFDTFVKKETKLRAVLYEIDLAPNTTKNDMPADTGGKDNSWPATATADEISQTEVENLNVSQNVPPLPTAFQQEAVPEEAAAAALPKTAATKVDESLRSPDTSFVIVDREQDGDVSAYSPGGRPLIPRPITLNTHSARVSSIVEKPPEPPVEDRGLPSPSDNAPQVVSEDYANTGPLSPELSAPIVLPEYSPGPRMAATSNGPLPMPVKFEPSRPVYTPFRYGEGAQNQSDQLEVQHPGDQDYASKRNTYDSSRLMANTAKLSAVDLNRVSSPISAKRVQEETFLGLLRSHSTVRPKDKLMNIPESIRPRTTPPSSQMRPDPIKDAVQALRASLPPTLPEKSRNGRVIQLRQRMEAFVDDFSFIRDTVIPWDRDNREERKRLDEERHRRQEESETRLDELFDDHEIVYAELKVMETDFKLAEAERRYEEDKQELESFTQGVYNVVTSRLQQQVDDLNKEYFLAIDLLDMESDPASRMLKGDAGRSLMAEAMDVVLQLFEKLNIRYHKLAEARFERERRRKRLELTVLYTNGDSEGTKKLERQFSTAEKLQLLHEARDKDQRASKLTDTFERATVRALGDNQGYLEDLFAKIKALNSALPANGAWQQQATETVYGKNGARIALTDAHAVVDFVLQDSRALLSASNMADKILNDADYAVSVAEAKVASATDTMHSTLKADKEKEDAKLLEEVRMRMDSITKTPSDAASLIQEIVDRIGNDKEHPERMQKALEAAKMRNAVNKLE